MESCGVDSPYLPQNSDPNNHAQIPLSLSSVDEESGSPSNLIPFNLSKDQVGKPLKCFSGNIWSRRLMNPQLSICKDMTECVVNCNVNTKSGQRNEGMWFLASKDKKQTTSPWRNTHTHTHTQSTGEFSDLKCGVDPRKRPLPITATITSDRSYLERHTLALSTQQATGEG